MKKNNILSYLIPLICIGFSIIILKSISSITSDMELNYDVRYFDLKLFFLYFGLGVLIVLSTNWKDIRFKIYIKSNISQIGILIISFLIGTSFIFDIDFVITMMTNMKLNYTLTISFFQVIFGYSLLSIFVAST